MNNWVEATGKAFERLLRWLFPGILFLVLLYLFREPSFNELTRIKGYPWPVIIGGLGVGTVIYLIEMNVVHAFVRGISIAMRWHLLEKPKRNKRAREMPVGCLGRIVCWWDKQADDIEAKLENKGSSNYEDYLNATHHATCITGWLTLILYFLRECPSPLCEVGSFYIWGFFGVMIAASLYQHAKLNRIRYCRDPQNLVD